MVDLTSQKEQDKDEKVDQLSEVVDEDNDNSTEDTLETVLLTGFAAIIMGILIFLFR
ncbi:hypothetical protein [Clostridium magnum]|uniref:Uncharacterized protein n=1 Tax=Clostridium magnum DSM 2767 TaxID=1121326 RepID=A0A162S2I8_9CLOT|nr:hypothetical protein [Clostridium magnum]KZL90691.1 hypothetical protein CLMAG_35920 [Clostridium magnum DSM 2767]SHI40399.1 hypothetical protein SAMN02745944_04258 [Clostridium magnum DSM 2767]